MAAYMNTVNNIQHTQVWHLRDTSMTSQTHFRDISESLRNTSELKNTSDIIIRGGNNFININMLSSNCNIIPNVNLNHHKYH